jgi:hypothetical protein
MPGTLTIARRSIATRNQPVRKYTFAWTSDASGAVSGTLSEFISGTIVGVDFIPGAAAAQPSDAYDVTLLNGSGIDVLAGQGANLSNVNKSSVCPGVPFKDGTTTSIAPRPIDSELELRVANAGNAKSGTLILFVR